MTTINRTKLLDNITARMQAHESMATEALSRRDNATNEASEEMWLIRMYEAKAQFRALAELRLEIENNLTEFS